LTLFSRRRADVLVVTAAALAATVLAGLVAYSPQLALTAVIVVVGYCLHLADRRAAFVFVWLSWLLVPGVRRILGLDGYVEADPLSVAPFVLTLMVAALELTRGEQPPLARRVPGLVIVGWLVGLPAGLAMSPEAALYNLIAYAAAAGAYLIGFNEPARRVAELTLVRALVVGGPILAAYAAAQYLLPLTPWDKAWLESVDVVTFGAPEAGKVRVFGTLNAPGVLAGVLALAVLWTLCRRRVNVPVVVGAIVMALALGLTYVRSSWIALAAALVMLCAISGVRGLSRAALPLAAVIAVVLTLAPVSPTAAAVVDRFDTLNALGEDTSAQTRSSTWTTLVPEAASRPGGHGLGTAGEGSKLAGASPLRAADNGYLSLLYQTGPVGALLVLAGLLTGVAAAGRRAWPLRRELSEGAFLLSAIALILVFMVSGDHFYGVMGVVLFYLLGAGAGALWRDYDGEDAGLA
jgi:hypothetical protein